MTDTNSSYSVHRVELEVGTGTVGSLSKPHILSARVHPGSIRLYFAEPAELMKFAQTAVSEAAYFYETKYPTTQVSEER